MSDEQETADRRARWAAVLGAASLLFNVLTAIPAAWIGWKARRSASPRGQRLAIMGYVGGPLLAFLSLAWSSSHKAGPGEECKSTEKCASGLVCGLGPGESGSTKCIDCAKTDDCARLGQCSPNPAGSSCVVSDCKTTPACLVHGRCASTGVFCANDDTPSGTTRDAWTTVWESCGPSKDCVEKGLCAAEANVGCVICEKSEACAKLGHCTPNAGTCTVATDRDCSRTPGCRTDGHCSFVANAAERCAARKNEDCANSEVCKSSGKCALENGRCIATEATCAQSDACRQRGACGVVDGACAVTKSEDCAKSLDCLNSGLCAAKDSRCVATAPAHCTSSAECKTAGACSVVEDKCKLASSGDCKRAEACAKEGRCTFKDDACVVGSNADCAPTTLCKEEGKCTARDGECAIGSTSDCRKTEGCRESGQCTFRDGDCTAATDSDCATSASCRKDSQCTAEGGSCVKRLKATVCQIHNEYKANEVAAKSKYSGERVKVTCGAVEGVREGPFGGMYIKCSCGFWDDTEMKVSSSDDEKVKSVRPGQSVTLTCDVGSMVLGAVDISDCEFP
jgi:hypothetical protein